MLYSFQHSCMVRVRYGETDQMGYVYYGVYAQYFEVGRVEAMRSLGIPYKLIEEKGIMLPVNHLEVNYKAPARYDDPLKIVTRITEVRGPRIVFHYQIFNNEEKELVNGSTTLVFVARQNMKPIPAPNYFTEVLKHFVVNDL